MCLTHPSTVHLTFGSRVVAVLPLLSHSHSHRNKPSNSDRDSWCSSCPVLLQFGMATWLGTPLLFHVDIVFTPLTSSLPDHPYSLLTHITRPASSFVARLLKDHSIGIDAQVSISSRALLTASRLASQSLTEPQSRACRPLPACSRRISIHLRIQKLRRTLGVDP